MKNLLAIIPARNGSQRLKNKNLLKLEGKTLVDRAVEFAINSKKFKKIFISTNYKSIKKKYETHNFVDCPYLRSEKISKDTTTTDKVCLDVIKFYNKKNFFFDAIILLQPTSPFREKNSLNKVLKIFFSKKNKDRNTVMSTKYVRNYSDRLFYFRNNYLNLNKRKSKFTENRYFFYPNGAYYVFSPKKLISSQLIFTKKNLFYNIENESENIDIDEEMDYKKAKALIRYVKKNKTK